MGSDGNLGIGLNRVSCSVPGNYCPISVVPVVAKVLEKVVTKQLYPYFESCQCLRVLIAEATITYKAVRNSATGEATFLSIKY